MTKSTKIMLTVIACVLAVCVVITAAVSISGRNNTEQDPAISDTGVSSANNSSVSASSGNSAQSSATTEPQKQLSELIIGKWMDSANMSGYEFFENGSVNVTYVNLTVPVVNLPINGTAKGTYTLSGSTLTVKFSIYSKTITKVFTASIDGSALVLKDTEDGETATYERVSSEQATASDNSDSSLNNSVIGGWTNSDGSVKYLFNEDGTAKVSLTNSASAAFNGNFDGVYMINGSKLTVQFTASGGTVTQDFEYTVSKNSMSLKDDSGQTHIFVRDSSLSASDETGLVGKWLDSSGMSGYNFNDDGTVEITYVNFTVPVINMPINGTFNGSYIVDGQLITISASIYSKSISDTYTYSISGNTLTLTNADDGKVSTYTKQ